MRLLVSGSHGLVGSNIIPQLKERFDVTAVDIEEWDITDREMGERLIRGCAPHVVINLAAMTDVDGCEDREEEAGRINSDGPAVVAELCRDHGARLVHFSTDYVFDGEKSAPYGEEDEPNPMSAYGRTKLSGERRVFAALPSALVIRAQWIYGRGGANFITKVTKAAEDTGAVRVVNDQRGAPTFAKDLALPVMLLIEAGRSGIYHVADGGSCTWFDFAKEIFSCLRMDVSVTPITSDHLDRKAKRPKNSVFNLAKVRTDTGAVMRPWQEALRDYLFAT